MINIVKILLICFVLDIQWISAVEQRYNIFDTSLGVILLDKEDGTAWSYAEKGWLPILYPIKETEEKTIFCFSPRGQVMTIDSK